MKKQYISPVLTNHGNVQNITQLFGRTDKNDFLFFAGNSNPVGNPITGNPATGDGSIDGIIQPNGTVRPAK